jgi:hypothetical protein
MASPSDTFYPMMMRYEVEALERILTSFQKGKTVYIVEWGSGNSTIYFTRLLKKKSIPYLWASIEHDNEWYERVRKEVAADPHVMYRHVPKENQSAYVTEPRRIAKEQGFGAYDIALVDGIYRNKCIEEAKTLAQTVLLHDAQRKSYGATGTFIAGRLLRVGPPNPLSRIQVLRFRIHEILWKMKERLFPFAK